jgi:hypothetical protein
MITATAADQKDAGTMARVALGLGILALIGFFGLGFAAGGWWFVVALIVGLAAVGVGYRARRSGLTRTERRMTLAGMICGGLVVVWFVLYMIIAAIF